MKGGESCPDRGGRCPPVRARKLRSRGQKSRPWRAERRRAPATVRAHKGWLRRSARHTLGFMPGSKGDYGVPGAAKNTGDDARLLVIPGREHSERTRNPEMQAQRVALDSGSGTLRSAIADLSKLNADLG